MNVVTIAVRVTFALLGSGICVEFVGAAGGVVGVLVAGAGVSVSGVPLLPPLSPLSAAVGVTAVDAAEASELTSGVAVEAIAVNVYEVPAVRPETTQDVSGVMIVQVLDESLTAATV